MNNQNQMAVQETNSTRSIINALEQGDKMQVNLILKKNKFKNGAVDFTSVLRIPFNDRIANLVETDGYEKIHKMIGAAIQIAMENLNLSKPLNAEQIFELTDTLIESSGEDYLGIEDVLLFLQKLVRGETGNL